MTVKAMASALKVELVAATAAAAAGVRAET